MNGSTTISVAMCTCNGAPYLRQQLESITAQTHPPNELVVCDDRSTDNTVTILKNYMAGSTFPVHLFFNEHQLGPTNNFEKAISLCTGNLVALSDQDDIWRSDKLEWIADAFARSPQAGAVFSNADVVNEHGDPLGLSLWQDYFNKSDRLKFAEGHATEVLLRHNVVTGATLALRAEFRNLLLPIPSQWLHDAWIALMIAACADIVPLPEPLIQYRRHSQQRIGLRPPRQWLDYPRSRDSYAAVAAHYELARDRLAAFTGQLRHPELVGEIQHKIDHYNFRATLPPQAVQRVPKVLREWLNGGYGRYSNSWRSAANDLFFWIDRTPPAV